MSGQRQGRTLKQTSAEASAERVETRQEVAKAAGEDYEDVVSRVRMNLGVLIQLASAEQLGDRGGTRIEIEHDAWRAIELMLIDAWRGVIQLGAELDRITEGGAQ